MRSRFLGGGSCGQRKHEGESGSNHGFTMTEKRQKTEDRRQKTGDRRQKAGTWDRGPGLPTPPGRARSVQATAGPRRAPHVWRKDRGPDVSWGDRRARRCCAISSTNASPLTTPFPSQAPAAGVRMRLLVSHWPGPGRENPQSERGSDVRPRTHDVVERKAEAGHDACVPERKGAR